MQAKARDRVSVEKLIEEIQELPLSLSALLRWMDKRGDDIDRLPEAESGRLLAAYSKAMQKR